MAEICAPSRPSWCDEQDTTELAEAFDDGKPAGGWKKGRDRQNDVRLLSVMHAHC